MHAFIAVEWTFSPVNFPSLQEASVSTTCAVTATVLTTAFDNQIFQLFPSNTYLPISPSSLATFLLQQPQLHKVESCSIRNACGNSANNFFYELDRDLALSKVSCSVCHNSIGRRAKVMKHCLLQEQCDA